MVADKTKNTLQTHKHAANAENTFINMTTLKLPFTNALQIKKTPATPEALQSTYKHDASESEQGNVSGRPTTLDSITLKNAHI